MGCNCGGKSFSGRTSSRATQANLNVSAGYVNRSAQTTNFHKVSEPRGYSSAGKPNHNPVSARTKI